MIFFSKEVCVDDSMQIMAVLQKQKRSHGSSKKTVADETMDVEQGATSDQDEEDDDEMLYVRGASPIMRSGYNSPTHGYLDEPFAFMGPGELVFALHHSKL
jgi:hypothetical protein